MAAWHACNKTSTEFTMQQYAIVLNYNATVCNSTELQDKQ